MKSDRSRLSVLPTIGSQSSEAWRCLTPGTRSNLPLGPVLTDVQKRSLTAANRPQHLPTIPSPIDLSFAKDQEAGINTHRVELGRRFSPIHF